ncbi:photosystem II protein V [Iris pallida]|uniref:Photosystem II protein V (Chloroplast) n=1 Tax=Iris pallida TaxID=29817 RepID=A0AAX6F8D8_IRIPA|nr:photosystem II protein V [Iris pallida]
MEESEGNGRYYWKDSFLVDRYCSWYSCDQFSRYFLLRFIFRVGFISIETRL